MNARLQDEPIEGLRLPPHSLEAEQAVLGALLLKNEAWDEIGDLIGEKDFYRTDHRLLWRTIIGLIEENKPADVLTLKEVLASRGEIQDAGGLTYLHQLAGGSPGTANIRRYAEIVRDHAMLRKLAEAGTIITDIAYATRGREARAVLDEAEKRILEVGEQTGRRASNFHAMSPTLAQVMTKLDELHRNPASVTGKATGFIDLDEMTTGLQDGDLIVVAGRPSMGKSGFALNIAEHIALEEKKPVLIFSLEMSAEQLTTRLLSSVGRVDSQKLRTGKLDMVDWDRLSEALGKLNEAPIFIDESGQLNPLELRARARRKWRELGGLGLIVVDYLQLMEGVDARPDNRVNEIAEITRGLKSMAKELSCPVIALSQLNRSLENRTSKRPRMSDLRESGAVENDSDVILFIYRDEVYDEESPDKGTAEIIVGKQRNGPIGTVRLTFMGKHTRFENYSGASEGGYTPRAPRRPPRKSFTEKDD